MLTGLAVARQAAMRRLRRSAPGAAAVEFALVAPVLIAMLLGVSDLAPTMMAKFKTGNATQSVADLATQYSALQTSDLVNVYSAGADVLAPFAGSGLVLRITSVASDGNGNAFVYWSCGQGTLTPWPARSSVTATPTGVSVDSLLWRYNVWSGGYNENGTNTSYVMVESTYSYTAPARFVLPNQITMSNIAYMLPRVSAYVGFPWDGTQSNPPAAPASATRVGSTTLSNGAVCSYAY